jgi:hypothetical protein
LLRLEHGNKATFEQNSSKKANLPGVACEFRGFMGAFAMIHQAYLRRRPVSTCQRYIYDVEFRALYPHACKKAPIRSCRDQKPLLIAIYANIRAPNTLESLPNLPGCHIHVKFLGRKNSFLAH